MYEKKVISFKTPNLNELQEVVIDLKTKIYIAIGADPEEARARYISKHSVKKQ